jgi:hypothetical protein
MNKTRGGKERMSEWLSELFTRRSKKFFTLLDVFTLHFMEDSWLNPQQKMTDFKNRWGDFNVATCQKVLVTNQNEDDRCIALWLIAFQQAYPLNEFIPYLTSLSVKERWTSAFILGERKDSNALSALCMMLTEFLPLDEQPVEELSWWIACRREWIPSILRSWMQPEITVQLRLALEVCLMNHAPDPVNKDALYWYEDALAYELGYRNASDMVIGIKTTNVTLHIAMIHAAMGVYAAKNGGVNHGQLKSALLRYERWVVDVLQQQLKATFNLSEQEVAQILDDDFQAQRQGRDKENWVNAQQETDNCLLEIPPFF